MPVDLRTHNSADDISIDPSTNKAAIIKLLYTNPHYGFMPAEIHDRLEDIPKGSITATLGRLLEEGYVGKTTDGYYHALENRDDVRRFAKGLVQVETLTDRYRDDRLSPPDVEQTGKSSVQGSESPTNREEVASEEPAPKEWIESTDDDESKR